ncbi:MAG: CHAT domain-containing tetratricopeptide repeat protein [Synechococcaceae cyanobacterium]|nr:CHAT domain-containing tetratricopeptide repeat protein [Synechococcaceae cyanobacterium]
MNELLRQAEALEAKGAYADALNLLQQALQTVEKIRGPEHWLTAGFLNRLAKLYQDQGRYRDAESFHRRALAIFEKVLGPEDPITAKSLQDLAGLYRQQVRFGDAEPLYQRALVIRQKVLGPEHVDTATSLNNLAELYRQQVRFGEAEPLYQRALAIRQKVLGPEHVDTATSLNNLAALFQAQGRYGEADLLYKRSLEISEKVQGLEHAATARTLNNLAVLYQDQGRFGEAEPLFLRSLAVSERVLGPEHVDIATSLNNLAGLFRAQGRYGESEPAYKRSLAISEKVLGPEHPLTATILCNLAGLYEVQNRYGEAEPLYQRALAIRQKVLGPEHVDIATSLNNLAGLFQAQGRYGEADLLYKRSLAILVKALGPEHPATATILNNLAGLYGDQGRNGEAEHLYKRSLAISERALGPEHPDTANSLFNLGTYHLRNTNSTAAAIPLQRLNQQQASWLRRELPLQTREWRSHLIAAQPDAPSLTFALLDQNPTSAPLALETRLNRQGLLAEIERRQSLLKGSSPETRRLAEQLAGIDRLLASVSLPQAQREPLRQQRQQLEAQLYRLLPSLKIDPVSNGQVAAALKAAAPKGLLLEFQRYRPLGNGAKGHGGWGPPRYVALLLRPDGTIGSIPLGAAEPIDAAIAEAVAATADPNRQQVAPDRLKAVSQLLLKPLQAELAGVRDLFVSPDGELNRLPFAALPMAEAKGPTLGESVQLRLLTTGRELVRLQQPAKTGNGSTMIMNPDFGPPDSSVKNPWQPLESTAREARELAPLLKPQAVISGRQATTAVVLQQNSPRILHIATHGFFLADEPGKGQGKQGFEALQRSGLVFAGANQPTANPADDGYLTAAEATAINLEGTELVTLSACETALGGVQSGEGVYGLQRALAVAGARSTLLSLWKVEDGRTATFLARYYEKLKAGQGRAEALRKTQIEYRASEDTNLNDVRVWGAFQLSGDWRPIRGW